MRIRTCPVCTKKHASLYHVAYTTLPVSSVSSEEQRDHGSCFIGFIFRFKVMTDQDASPGQRNNLGIVYPPVPEKGAQVQRQSVISLFEADGCPGTMSVIQIVFLRAMTPL